MASTDGKWESFSNVTTKKKIPFTRLIPFSENVNQQHSMVSFTDIEYPGIDTQPTLLIPLSQITGEAIYFEAQSSEGIPTLIKKLVKSSGIYAIASLVNPFIALILAPFLTHHMTYTEYGALTVINTAIALIAGITQLGLSSAFFRSYHLDYETKKDRQGVLSISLILLVLITLPTAIVMSIASPWITTFLLKSSDPVLISSVRLLGAIVVLQNLAVPGLAWMRAENRAAFFALLSITNLVISLVANIVLVGVLQMGINGSLIATGLGYSIIVICTLPSILKYAGLHIRWDIAKGMLAFGVPNMFSFVSVWVLQLADRSLLAHFGSLSETANYSIAYSLGSVLGVAVLSPFQLAWPSVQFTIAKRNDAARVFQQVFRWYGIVLLFTTYAFSLVAIAILDILFPVRYRSASPIIPIIGLSIMLYGVYSYTNIGLGVRKKTWIVVALTAIGALINFGCNIVFIPFYGSMGAALSTLIAYAALAALGYFVNQRIYPIPFEIARFMLALSLGIALFMGSTLFIHMQEIDVTWSIDIGILCFYGGCLLVLGNIPRKQDRFEEKIWRRKSYYERFK